jgi:ATPase family associated with various cellular activities (AAA)
MKSKVGRSLAPPPLSFADLTEARRFLQRFCLLHVTSIFALRSGISFKHFPDDKGLGKKRVRHLTTTATCFSSLLDSTNRPDGFQGLLQSFATKALDRVSWKSEGSAGIYCRCRALPTVIDHLPAYDNRLEEHIRVILEQLEHNERPERFAIGEAGSALKHWQWYPPNAFHTYWTMEIFDRLKIKFRSEYDRLSAPSALDIKRRRDGMLLWARQQLGSQIGLHSASPPSSMLDSDQLAWSLAIFLRFDDSLNVDLENRDFVKNALGCLFSTQTDGTWRHYKPLFHYKKAGNAYCYVFETFAALLQCGLRPGAEAQMFRDLLKPYSRNLMDLWRYADSTKMDLWRNVNPTRKPKSATGTEIGWCSGHRTNVTSPESWATASVFSYAQALRRLVGIWCREEALAALNTPQIPLGPKQAANEVISRGETWGAKAPVSEQLCTAFVNPVLAHDPTDRLEPDSRPIDENHARSAILFGPPGTSKTTLIRSLARAISWDYVELHASHFVAEGLGEVQKTADGIFRQLSELDHAVVLFDEIDELVRERDMEKDAFGRFLTTSMLPKLAELWDSQKILYFVATNHINYFDSAIIRSHRFDALILVSPPSFGAKVRRLKELLAEDYPNVLPKFSKRQIQKELDVIPEDLKKFCDSEKSRSNDTEEALKARWMELPLNPDLALAKFVLLRFDELYELANRLAEMLADRSSVPTTISTPMLKDALKLISDTEWRKNKSYHDYLRDTRSERRDHQMLNVWEVRSKISPIPGVFEANDRRWFARAVDSSSGVRMPEFRVRFPRGGRIEILPK